MVLFVVFSFFKSINLPQDLKWCGCQWFFGCGREQKHSCVCFKVMEVLPLTMSSVPSMEVAWFGVEREGTCTNMKRQRKKNWTLHLKSNRSNSENFVCAMWKKFNFCTIDTIISKKKICPLSTPFSYLLNS